jgi:hypothetical protein
LEKKKTGNEVKINDSKDEKNWKKKGNVVVVEEMRQSVYTR